MAVISEVKCGRCDRRYSGLRTRCPYCGARRNRRGKRAEDENAKANLIVGVVLIVVLIAATMILLFSSLPERGGSGGESIESPPAGTASLPPEPGGEETTPVENSPGTGAEVSEEPSIPPTEQVQITKVVIKYAGGETKDFTLKVGESIRLSFATEPETTGKTAVWKSSNESVFTVVDGKVTGVGRGSAKLTCTVDGVSAECIVRVKAA